MGIFGAAKKGFGMLGKSQAKKKMLSGTSTRADRLKHGVRDKTISRVPASEDVKKGDVKESIRKGKQHFYLKNIDELEKHQKVIRAGEKAKKKIQHMKDTKRAFTIGSDSTRKTSHASDPTRGSKEWDK
tara:strand:+ start:37 stop:423 length:387 start_codon:yes stop_codon:yes gene_type:complete